MPVTGMSNSANVMRAALLRGGLWLLGLATLLWFSAVLPSFLLTAPAREAFARIVANERFKPGALDSVLARMQAFPHPSFLQPEFFEAEALVSLRTAEEAMQRRTSEKADYEVEAAADKLKSALLVSPTDSFLWLMLYSAETARKGFDKKQLAYLERSYVAGLYEGWVSIRRNRLGLAVFPLLGSKTQDMVVSEFAELVDAEFIEDSVTSLIGVGWTNRDRLLFSLTAVDIASRQAFAKRLAAEGIKLKVPGMDADERPWR